MNSAEGSNTAREREAEMIIDDLRKPPDESCVTYCVVDSVSKLEHGSFVIHLSTGYEIFLSDQEWVALRYKFTETITGSPT